MTVGDKRSAWSHDPVWGTDTTRSPGDLRVPATYAWCWPRENLARELETEQYAAGCVTCGRLAGWNILCRRRDDDDEKRRDAEDMYDIILLHITLLRAVYNIGLVNQTASIDYGVRANQFTRSCH